MVIEGLKSNIFDTQKKEPARVALKRLRKNRCVKSIEYIIQVTSGSNPLDSFAKEIFGMEKFRDGFGITEKRLFLKNRLKQTYQ